MPRPKLNWNWKPRVPDAVGITMELEMKMMTTSQQVSPTEELLTMQQTAERLGLSRRQLERLCTKRRISYFKRGGRLFFAPEEVERVLKAFEVPALQPVVKVKELETQEVAR
jgi:excisionase family DNA binding protein